MKNKSEVEESHFGSPIVAFPDQLTPEKSNQEQIKRQIQNLNYQSFDISSFAESKNQPRMHHQQFPVINAPTLQLKLQYEDQQFSQEKTYHNRAKKREDSLTARHDQLSLIKMEQQIANLKKMLELKEKTIEKCHRTNQALANKLQVMQEKLDEQKEKNNRLKKQVEIAKHMSVNESKSELSNAANFYPQLFSPQETLTIFKKLLRTVHNSTTMTKNIQRDEKIMQIIGKLSNKNRKN